MNHHPIHSDTSLSATSEGALRDSTAVDAQGMLAGVFRGPRGGAAVPTILRSTNPSAKSIPPVVQDATLLLPRLARKELQAPLSSMLKLLRSPRLDLRLPSLRFDSCDSIQGFELRPYQNDCVEACLKGLQDGLCRIGVSCPTGSGKTVIFTSLISRLPPIIDPSTTRLATKVLIVVGAIQLAEQSAMMVRKLCPNLTVEVEQGTSHVASGSADVTIATYQTLSRGGMARLEKFDPRFYKAVIVDEAHHAAAKSYRDILSVFDSRIALQSLPLDLWQSSTPPTSPIISQTSLSIPSAPPSALMDRSDTPTPAVPRTIDELGRPCVPIFGFTATFSRPDGLALGKIFEKIVYHSEWLSMIKGGWLSQCKFTTVQLGDALDLSSLRSSGGDFVLGQLANVVDTEAVTAMAISAWRSKAANRRSTLVFAVNIAHIYSLVDAFRAAGIDARGISQQTSIKDRNALLDDFRHGVFKVLINCGILTEGADFPSIDCILLARPTRSRNLLIQMLGRGLRLSPETGKKDCLIIDLVGNSNKGVESTCTLFGIDPSTVVDNKSSSELTEMAEIATLAALGSDPPPVPTHEMVFTNFATIFDLVDRFASRPRSISSLSSLGWVGIGNSKFILPALGGGWTKIERVGQLDPPLYEATFTFPFVPHATSTSFKSLRTPIHIAESTNLPSLFQRTDVAVQERREYQRSLASLDRRARWRFLAATVRQTDFVRSHLCEASDHGLSGSKEEDYDPDAPEDAGDVSTIDGMWVGRPYGERVSVKDLTKGQAADTITRILHGGKTVFKKMQKQMWRDMRGGRRSGLVDGRLHLDDR